MTKRCKFNIACTWFTNVCASSLLSSWLGAGLNSAYRRSVLEGEKTPSFIAVIQYETLQISS